MAVFRAGPCPGEPKVTKGLSFKGAKETGEKLREMWQGRGEDSNQGKTETALAKTLTGFSIKHAGRAREESERTE